MLVDNLGEGVVFLAVLSDDFGLFQFLFAFFNFHDGVLQVVVDSKVGEGGELFL